MIKLSSLIRYISKKTSKEFWGKVLIWAKSYSKHVIYLVSFFSCYIRERERGRGRGERQVFLEQSGHVAILLPQLSNQPGTPCTHLYLAWSGWPRTKTGSFHCVPVRLVVTHRFVFVSCFCFCFSLFEIFCECVGLYPCTKI